jgi:hypothetical protein
VALVGGGHRENCYCNASEVRKIVVFQTCQFRGGKLLDNAEEEIPFGCAQGRLSRALAVQLAHKRAGPDDPAHP